MKILRLFFTLTILFCPALSQAVQPGEISSVKLRDEGSFGYARETEIVLSRDGTALFHGGKNSSIRPGDFRGSLDRKQFQALTKLLVTEKFLALKDRYEGKISDVGTKTITVVYEGGGEKAVINWGGSDLKPFARISNFIGKITESVQWHPVIKANNNLESSSLFALLNFDFADWKISESFRSGELKNLIFGTPETGKSPTFYF